MIKYKHTKLNQLNRKIIFLLGSLCVLFLSFSYSQVQGVSYSVGKVVTGDAATTYTVPYTITPADTVGSTFTANTSGGGTITLGNGQTLTVSNLPTTVQDAAGTVYQADDKGKLTKVGTNSSNAGAMLATANLTVVDASKGTVTFAPTSDMKYAFDAWQKAYDGNSAWSKRYETLSLSGGAKGGSYRVSSKLMVPGEADKVLAIINLNDKKLVADSVRFVNAKGTLFEKKKITDNSCELSLVGGPAGDAQEVYALYPSPQGEGAGVRSYTLGKLLVATYEPKTINLALVPVNGATLDSEAIAEELKKVYEPLGIEFNLTTKDNFKYKALETASLKVEGSGLLSVYTEQMKALNRAYVDSLGSAYDVTTVYMFALKQGAGKDEGKTVLGDMPRGKQFGYIFTDGQDGASQGATAAHEIGHGIFQLQHTFSYSGMADATFSAANVMNYPAGEALSKLQWDLMHDPGLVISVFETDKGVEIVLQGDEYLGFTPNGKVIKSRPTDYNGVFLANDSYFITGFKTIKGNYTWNGEVYQNTAGDKFSGWIQEPVTGKVAIWNPNFDEKCFTLYKWINVKNYTKDQFESIKQKVANDDGSGWKTDYVAPSEECKAAAKSAVSKLSNRRKLLFVNGYDLASKLTNNKIEITDSRSYWSVDGDYGIDERFINALKPSNIYYADGNMSITTSNHRSISNFVCSAQNNIDITLDEHDFKECVLNLLPQVILTLRPERYLENSSSEAIQKLAMELLICEFTGLNTNPNRAGFDERRKAGKIAGNNLLTKMKMDKAIFKNKYGVNSDTLDIVCHSMGYAYALGMIDVLKDSVTFGRFYIIAPENAESGGTDWNMFTEVWQYGSDEEALKNTPKLQDGVAPQVPVQGIEKLPTEKTLGGRAYIPSKGVPQGFLKSHSIGNYKWIFKINPPSLNSPNKNGYVTPR